MEPLILSNPTLTSTILLVLVGCLAVDWFFLPRHINKIVSAQSESLLEPLVSLENAASIELQERLNTLVGYFEAQKTYCDDLDTRVTRIESSLVDGLQKLKGTLEEQLNLQEKLEKELAQDAKNRQGLMRELEALQARSNPFRRDAIKAPATGQLFRSAANRSSVLQGDMIGYVQTDHACVDVIADKSGKLSWSVTSDEDANVQAGDRIALIYEPKKPINKKQPIIKVVAPATGFVFYDKDHLSYVKSGEVFAQIVPKDGTSEVVNVRAPGAGTMHCKFSKGSDVATEEPSP